MKPKSNRASPQGLKPFTYARSNGTAEAVPFQNLFMR